MRENNEFYLSMLRKMYPDGETAYLYARGAKMDGLTSESDLNYCRLELIGGMDIAFTPGKSFGDRKVYRGVYVEFNGCVHYNFRETHKTTGRPLKKAVKEILNSNALHIDTEYKEERFDGNYIWNASYRLSPLESEIWGDNYDYTKKGVLQFLNRYGVKKYNNVVIIQAAVNEIVNKIGGIREKEILNNDSVMSIGETWTDTHKVITVTERVNNKLGRSFDVDLITGRITG
jgi:hypothetical protein